MTPSAGGRKRARKILGLPDYETMILVGVHNIQDHRKGMALLKHALQGLPDKLASIEAIDPSKVCILLAGRLAKNWADDLPFHVHALGYLQSEVELSLAYQSADLYVSSSIEDGGPMMVSQAMLCGTPVVAFQTGIAEELLGDGACGYMANLGDAEDLAQGIVKVLANRHSMAPKARTRAAAHHAPEKLVAQLEYIFEAALAAKSNRA
jgi:glycosyltransferase involved in cell wall biosynthesis